MKDEKVRIKMKNSSISSNKLLLSIVVPVFNEEQTINDFFERITPILLRLELNIEFIFVDDGSTDQSVDVIRGYMCEITDITVVRLSRNFGKESALTAGLEVARGNAVIPIDADLQDPPELIPELVKQWQNGYDVVYGIRKNRRSDSIMKRATAGLFYRLFNQFSKTPLPRDAGDFRLMDRRVVEVVNRLPEKNRFMKGIFAWVGFKSIGVPYERNERSAGTSKWNYWRLWNFALDAFTGYSTLPLRIWSYVGAFVALLSFIFGIYVFGLAILGNVDVPGYASLAVMISFLGGLQLFSAGLLGEYVGRILTEVKNRPIYIIDEVVRDENKTKVN